MADSLYPCIVESLVEVSPFQREKLPGHCFMIGLKVKDGQRKDKQSSTVVGYWYLFINRLKGWVVWPQVCPQLFFL